MIDQILNGITAVGVALTAAIVIGVAWLAGVLLTMALERLFDRLNNEEPYDEEDD